MAKTTATDRDATLVARWKAGESIQTLCAESGLKRSAMRRILTVGAGGKDAFKQLRASGAGGVVEPFGGKRPARRAATIANGDGTRSPAPALVDDSDVPVVENTSRVAGWRSRHVWRARVVDVKDTGKVPWRERVALVHIAPDGIEYVAALASERADLLVRTPDKVIVRLRKFETSSTAKAMKREAKLVERGTKSLERTRVAKRAKRAARKARKETSE